MVTIENFKLLENAIKDYQNTLDSPITMEGLQEKMSNLKNGKACGFDGIRKEMLKKQQ